MSSRLLNIVFFAFSLSGCVTSHSPPPAPEASKWVPLQQALQILARDLNQSTPVVLSDVQTPEGKQQLKSAVMARQCTVKAANPPMPVITGPVSLQLQGSFTQTNQEQIQLGFPVAASAQFQNQLAKGQQQQLTVPITFVAASSLANFFLGQNLTNLSTLPDSPDPKGPEPKKPASSHAKGGEGDAPVVPRPPSDKEVLGQLKAKYQLALIGKADAISEAVKEQVHQYQSGGVSDELCKSAVQTPGIGLLAELPISIVLPTR